MSERSPRAFRPAAAEAQADVALGPRIRRATARFVAARTSRWQELPDADAARARARAIKLDAIDRSDELLDEFQARFEARGGHVHRVADAAGLRQRLLDIAQDAGARRAVKSKTMTGEEAGVDGALAAAGVKVLDTDLGDFIVQLAGQPPSHILVPAVHVDRHQVSALFQEHLGATPTEEIPLLTAQARAWLRRGFLSADLGISGANFLVADAGAMVLVENEGNGRMVTGLPRVARGAGGPGEADRPARRSPPHVADADAIGVGPAHLQLRQRAVGTAATGRARRPGGHARHRVGWRTGCRPAGPAPARDPGVPALRCLPQRLPRLPGGRRARLRLDLSRPDRGGAGGALPGPGRGRWAGEGEHPLWRLSRRLSRPDRHPRGAARPARAGGGGWRGPPSRG